MYKAGVAESIDMKGKLGRTSSKLSGKQPKEMAAKRDLNPKGAGNLL